MRLRTLYVLARGFFSVVPLPIHRRLIVFESNTRHGIVDNMKCVLQYMIAHCPDGGRDAMPRFVWLSRDIGSCQELPGVTVRKANSLKGAIAQATAKIIVSDDYLLGFVPVRKRQVYFNVWHGAVNYKKLGYEGLAFKTAWARRLFAMKNPEPDFMVAGSAFFAKDMTKAFRLKKTVFLPIGLPRNDLFFDAMLVAQARKKVLAHIGHGTATTAQENTKILLYAPSFRGSAQADMGFAYFYSLVPSVLDALKNRFGGEWKCLYRAHYFLTNSMALGDTYQNVSEYPDTQELLCATDFLISDYSSIMWDAMLLKIPCVSYAPDIETYMASDRGLTDAWRTIPFAVTKTQAQLLQSIATFDAAEYDKKAAAHIRKLQGYDTGGACKAMAEKIYQCMRGRDERT